MKKSWSFWTSVGALVLVVGAACGPGDDPEQPGGGPGSDAGLDAGWVACELRDGGDTFRLEDGGATSPGCEEGERCRYVESVGHAVCVSTCDPDNLCQTQGLVCCASENAGASGYCLPRNDCSPPSPKDGGETGTDAGSDATDDAGTTTDGGTTPDAGETPDAGLTPDAGTPDAGTATDAGTPDAGTGPQFATIRLMAANLTSGNLQSYDPGHGARLMQGVKPDVVMIQEFNYGDKSAAAIRGFVTNTFGAGFDYYREGGAQIPNGVISRWPIIASGEWDDPRVANRDFAWARIDIPGPRDLWVVSVHLLTASAGERNLEASSLVNYIQANNIPVDDYLAIGGDFNTDSRSESAFTTFNKVVVSAGPHPVDQNGREGTNASREKPYDNLLVDQDLRTYQTATVLGASTYSSGLVLDSRVYRPLSEIAPVQSGDSASSNMQHMGVVKDFRVPLQ